MEYKRIARTKYHYALFPSNIVIDELIQKSGPENDYYESIYTYRQEHYDKFIAGLKEASKYVGVKYNQDDLLNTAKNTLYKLSKLINDDNDKKAEQLKASYSVAGTQDITTNKLVFDFDSPDLEKSRQDAVQLVSRLISNSIARDAIQVSFSGNKGFSIEVETDLHLNRKEFENIINTLSKDLETFDTSVKDQQRLFRIPLTVNTGSGLYKIPLTLEELTSISSNDIRELAKPDNVKKNKNKFYDVMNTWTGVRAPESIIALKDMSQKEKIETDFKFDDRLELSRKPSWLSSTKFALQEGFFKEGNRNTAFMILAATYKSNGFPKEIAWRMLKGVAELQSERNKSDEYSEDKLWKEIICVVYGENWRGGTYSERETDLLKETAEMFNLSTENKENRLIQITDVADRFKQFAQNIDKNTIKTGIQQIDDNVLITTGMTVGILGSPGCHAKGTKVVMYDGTLKNVEDIVIGDLLIGPDSEPRTVLQLRSGREKMVKIKPLRSEEFIVNINHILNLEASKLKIKNRIPGYLNITVNNYINGIENKSSSIASYRLRKTGVEFNNKYELPIDPYFLGVWLGDGTSSKNDITTMDKEIADYCESYVTSLGLHFTKKYETGKAYTYVVTGNKQVNGLRTTFKELELFDNKHIPEMYLKASRIDRLKLLAGLLDTDGSLESNKTGWIITQKSKVLSDQIRYLARSLGFHASTTFGEKYCIYKGEKRIGQYYHTYISGLKEVYDVPVLLERKKPQRFMTSKNPLHYGFSYEILDEDNYYGFTLDKDHLYLTSDFIVHHNSGKTSIANNFARYLSQNNQHVLFESLDMSDNLLFARFIQSYSGYDVRKILKMVQNGESDPKLLEAFEKTSNDFKKVGFNFRSGTTVEDIEVDIKARQDMTGEKVKLVIVDYLEKVRGPYSDATANGAYVASRLSDLAREHDLCMMMLLQPQKSAGDPREPLLSMRKVKGASVIEQDCRVIMTMWRPGFNPQDMSDDKYASLAVVKNNMGQLCQMDFSWDGISGKLRNLTNDERYTLEALLQRIEDEKAKENEKDWI